MITYSKVVLAQVFTILLNLFPHQKLANKKQKTQHKSAKPKEIVESITIFRSPYTSIFFEEKTIPIQA